MRLLPTHCLTFPRSGHHLLVNMLRAYFGHELRYVESYEHPELLNQPEANFIKDHDFAATAQAREGWRVLVQIRDPMEAIASRWQAEHAKESEEARDDFFRTQLAAYAQFCNRWVVPQQPNKLVIHYRELSDQPLETLLRVLRHVTSDGAFDPERLVGAIKESRPLAYKGIRACYYCGPTEWSDARPLVTNTLIAPLL